MAKSPPTIRWQKEPTILWLDHMTLKREDLPYIRPVQCFQCWSIKLEERSMLQDLPDLWWLDWRGGSDTDLSWIGDLPNLRFLQIWHAYRLQSVDFLTKLQNLQGLMLHALPKVHTLPSLASCKDLHTVEFGRMNVLTDIKGLYDAPVLENLIFSGKVGFDPKVLRIFRDHPVLRRFFWLGMDESRSRYEAAHAALDCKEFKYSHREEWPFRNLAPLQEATLRDLRAKVRQQPTLHSHN